MMKQLSVVVAAMTLAWLAPGQLEAQQRCQANVDCGPGWVCAAKQCVQEGSVTVQAGAGAVGAQLSVTDQAAQLSVTDQGAQLSVTGPGDQLSVTGPGDQPQPHPVEYVERPILNPNGPIVGLIFGSTLHILISGFGSEQMSDRGSWIADDFRVMSGVPLAGPWIQLSLILDSGYDDVAWAAGLVFSGALQAGLLTLTILGYVPIRQVAVQADLGNGVDLAVSPGVGSLSASLTF